MGEKATRLSKKSYIFAPVLVVYIYNRAKKSIIFTQFKLTR